MIKIMALSRLFLIFTLFCSISYAHEQINLHTLPRPLIIDYTYGAIEAAELKKSSSSPFFGEELKFMECTSWRFAVETNNLSPWKTIPSKCADYVKHYMRGQGYAFDLGIVAQEAEVYAKSVTLRADEKDVWVFDIDETLLSNLPYYAHHGYGLEVFDHDKFDEWVEKGKAPAIESSLKLYEEVRKLGFKIFLLTGRSERHTSITIENLNNAGFHHWDKLILRSPEDQGKTATVFKSDKRDEMIKDDYRIHGNSGDQWSDLLGSSLADRSFKLPNPMYYGCVRQFTFLYIPPFWIDPKWVYECHFGSIQNAQIPFFFCYFVSFFLVDFTRDLDSV